MKRPPKPDLHVGGVRIAGKHPQQRVIGDLHRVVADSRGEQEFGAEGSSRAQRGDDDVFAWMSAFPRDPTVRLHGDIHLSRDNVHGGGEIGSGRGEHFPAVFAHGFELRAEQSDLR